MDRLKVAVLGATGIVGQRFVQLLMGHPWFELVAVAASEKSAGKKYSEAAKWHVGDEMPEEVASLTVRECTPEALRGVDLVFSALPSRVAGPIEEKIASRGFPIVSNAASHRMDPDVPLLIPEVNPDHIELLEEQKRRRKWDGFIVANPNCTSSVLAISLKPIHDQYKLDSVIASSMQAVSGAGYPGLSFLDISGNVIPYIKSEEEKLEEETKKILGSLRQPADITVSASCHRVPTRDGHMISVFLKTVNEVDVEDLYFLLQSFNPLENLNLPTAPIPPIKVFRMPDRPQTSRDVYYGNGMGICVGRIRKCDVLTLKYVVLGHNTIRGGAGMGVLNAELLKVRGVL